LLSSLLMTHRPWLASLLALSLASSVAALAAACGGETTGNPAGAGPSGSSSDGGDSGSPTISSNHRGSECGDAGFCGANEVCVSFNENLAGHPVQLNDAGQPIPYQGPEFVYDGVGCVPTKPDCDPLSCDCIVCPSLEGDAANRQFFMCSVPADQGSDSVAVASCDEPTA
jgi:hypothetical protein